MARLFGQSRHGHKVSLVKLNCSSEKNSNHIALLGGLLIPWAQLRNAQNQSLTFARFHRVGWLMAVMRLSVMDCYPVRASTVGDIYAIAGIWILKNNENYPSFKRHKS
jgi:hypothetical protein